MKNYRSFSDVEESYFRDHPEEMDEYLTLMFRCELIFQEKGIRWSVGQTGIASIVRAITQG